MILLTRFNNQTLAQNQRWKERNKWKGCIYGVRNRCGENWEGSIVVEMNNDTNKIIGLGIITGFIPDSRRRKAWKIYDEDKYNQVVYYGKERISLGNLSSLEESIIGVLETLLFSGKAHSKRGNSWALPTWIVENEIIDFDSELKSIMNKRRSL